MEKVTSFLWQTLLHVMGLDFICGLKKGSHHQSCPLVKGFLRWHQGWFIFHQDRHQDRYYMLLLWNYLLGYLTFSDTLVYVLRVLPPLQVDFLFLVWLNYVVEWDVWHDVNRLAGVVCLLSWYHLCSLVLISNQIEPGSQTEQAPPSAIFQLGPKDMHGFRFLTISVAPRPVGGLEMIGVDYY